MYFENSSLFDFCQRKTKLFILSYGCFRAFLFFCRIHLLPPEIDHILDSSQTTNHPMVSTKLSINSKPILMPYLQLQIARLHNPTSHLKVDQKYNYHLSTPQIQLLNSHHLMEKRLLIQNLLPWVSKTMQPRLI